MSTFNLIYRSSGNTYLWNGTAFDQLGKGKEALFYSGKSIKKENLRAALNQCREGVKRLFPNETDPVVHPVEVFVSN